MYKKLFVIEAIIITLLLFRPYVTEGVRTTFEGDGCEVKYGTEIPIDPYFNYIAYNPGKVGNHILTLLVHNPTNFSCDDYIIRWDIVEFSY